MVLPRTVFLAKGPPSFRRWLFERSAAPKRIDFLLNMRRWAFDTEPRTPSRCSSPNERRRRRRDAFEVAGVAASAAEFARQIAVARPHPATRALGPRPRGSAAPRPGGGRPAGEAAARPARFRSGGGRWQCFPVAEFHETNDAASGSDAERGMASLEGRSFDQFDPHGADERCCPPRRSRACEGAQATARARIDARGEGAAQQRGGTRSSGRSGAARVAFRDVTQPRQLTHRARLSGPAGALPRQLRALPRLRRGGPAAEAACLALMNSLAFDWQARRFVESHLNFFILEGLRLPALDEEDVAALAATAARLSCPDERFAEFAEATGVEWGPLEEEERAGLRAEIDARVARAWGLTTEELEIVFADFTGDAVPEAYREAVRERFAELGDVSRPELLDNLDDERRHGAALAYLVGDVDAKHPLAIATGYVNLGGLHQLARVARRAPGAPADRRRPRARARRRPAADRPLPRSSSRPCATSATSPASRPRARPRGCGESRRGFDPADVSGAAVHAAVPARQGLPVRRRRRRPGRAGHLGQPDRRGPQPQPRARPRPLPAERGAAGARVVRRASGTRRVDYRRRALRGCSSPTPAWSTPATSTCARCSSCTRPSPTSPSAPPVPPASSWRRSSATATSERG